MTTRAICHTDGHSDSGGVSSVPPWLRIADYDAKLGWGGQARGAERSRWCCEQLESGRILFFDGFACDFPRTDLDFLLQRRQSGSRMHKNISYRPKQDALRGSVAESKEDSERLRNIMRHFSQEITGLLTRVLAPYAPHWSLDFASYRPEEEQGRDLPLHKRNDLLHLDAFPSRPTRGGRILRCFTNINPERSRNWITTDLLRRDPLRGDSMRVTEFPFAAPGAGPFAPDPAQSLCGPNRLAVEKAFSPA